MVKYSPLCKKCNMENLTLNKFSLALMIVFWNLTIQAQSQYCAGYFDTKHSIKQTNIPTIRGNLVFPSIFKSVSFWVTLESVPLSQLSPHTTHITSNTTHLTLHTTNHISHTKHYTLHTIHPTPHWTHQNSTHLTRGFDTSGELTKHWVEGGWK